MTNEMMMIQFIEILDTLPPVLTSQPSDINTTTDARSCIATVNIEPIEFIDECGSDAQVYIQYENGTLESNGGQIELPDGVHTVTYQVFDVCNNFTEYDIEVSVSDQNAPVVICKQTVSVSLDSEGKADIVAEQINNESFDECSPLEFEIRRVLPGCIEGDTEWSEIIEFCCEDAGNRIMVELKATDDSGNSNTCMVEVVVDDKIPAAMTCIDDMESSCEENFDLDNLRVAFGFPTVGDNCLSSNAVEERVEDNRNECGIGTVVRYFDLRDLNGDIIQTCSQTITFDGLTDLLDGMIIWPENLDTADICQGSELLDPDLLPVQYAKPRLPVGFCNLMGMTKVDEVFTNTEEGDACYKIIRTWKVIDWCNRGDDGEFNNWEREQILKVSNTIDPEFVRCEPIDVESFDAACAKVEITASAEAEDDCTASTSLDYTYRIDFDNDGGFEKSGSGGSVTDSFEVGLHIIEWTVMDRCGNTDQCRQEIRVNNVKAPTPICIDGLSVCLLYTSPSPRDS